MFAKLLTNAALISAVVFGGKNREQHLRPRHQLPLSQFQKTHAAGNIIIKAA